MDALNSTPSPAEPNESSPKQKRRWLRRVVIALLLIVIVVFGLIATAPMIASTGPVRAFIVGKVNQQLNGSVKIDDTSFGWFSGQRVGGIKIFDEKQSLIAEIDRFETGLTIAGAARGNYDIGQTFIDINLTRLQVDRDGNTNLANIVKEQATAGDVAEDDSTKSKSSADTPLPNVRGKLTLKYRGTIEYVDRLGGNLLSPPLHIEPGEAVIDVKDINEAIENSIKLALRLGNTPAGSVEISGKVDAIDGGKLNLQKLVADQSVKMAGIDFAALTPLLRIARVDGEYTGIMNGQLALKADGASAASADGQITIDDTSITALPELQGDTLKLGKLEVPIKVSRTVGGDGVALIKITSLRINAPQFLVVLAGELNEQSLQNVADGKQPGADGWLSATVSLDKAAEILNQLPNAARLLPDVKITDGRFIQKADLTFRKDKIFAKSRLDIDAKGTREGKAIAIAPVGVSFDATYTPNVNPLRGVADLALVLTSDFAKATGGGATLDKLDFNGDGDLGKLRAQVAQFVDLGEIDLAGKFNFALGSKGDLQTPNSIIATNARVQLEGLNVRLPEQPPLKIGRLDVNTVANLGTDSNGGIARIADAKVTAVSSEQGQDKVLELAATANNVDLSTTSVESFELTNLSIASLPQLVNQFGAFVPALKENQILIVDGQVYASAAGAYDGKTQTLTLTKPASLSTPNLTVKRGGAMVLDREKITAQLLGTIALANGVSADFSQLSVNSSLFSLNKTEPPLKLKLDDSGAITGAGQVKLVADLPRANAALRAFGETPAQVSSGKLDATIDLAGGVGAESTMTINGLIDALTVSAPAGQAMQNEKVAIKATVKTAADLTALSAVANIDSSFAKVAISKADVRLSTADKPVGTYDMLQSLSADIGIPDLPKLHALANAFMPIATVEAVTDETEKPLAPLQITSGGAAIKLDVTRAGSITKVNLSDCRVTRLAMVRGENQYAFGKNQPINLKLAADIDAAGEKINSIRVGELDGDLHVARVTMPTPVVITDVLTNPKAAGVVEIDGKLEEITPILAVLQGGDELPYGGQFKVVQKLANAGDAVQLSGSVDVNDFAMRSADGSWTQLEKQIAIRNDLSADLAKSNATIKSITIDMPQTKALGVKLVGGVTDWVTARQLQDIRLDLTYDLAKLWPIVEPMLSPEMRQTLADPKFAGAYTQTFLVRGSYPDKPFNEAIRFLSADGELKIDVAQAAGLTVEKFTLPINLREGKASIAYADKPKAERFPAAAQCNGGTLNLNGFVVDLAADEPRLYGPKKQRILHNVTINPVLGDSIGKFINPVFANTDRSQGLLDVTVEQCDGVALVSKWATRESGTARIALSITDLDIANPLGSLMFGKIAGILNLGGLSKGEADTFKGEIRDAVVVIENGVTDTDLTIMLSEDIEATDPTTGKPIIIPKNMPLSFSGNIRLSDLKQKLRVSLPPSLVGKFIRVKSADMEKLFPSGVPISLAGTTTKPTVDVGDLARRLPEILLRSRLTGGKDGDDPIGQIGDIIGNLSGKKDRREEPRRDEEPRRRP